MYKIGIVHSVNASAGTVKVHFTDLDFVSHDLHIVTPFTGKDKAYYLPSVGDQVACLMDKNLEDGCVIGGIFSKADSVPTESGKDKVVYKFEDGTIFSYDKKNHEYKIKSGVVEFSIKQNEGFALKNGVDDLKSILSDQIDLIKMITVTVPSGGGVSSVPVNSVAFDLIGTRLSNFFST